MIGPPAAALLWRIPVAVARALRRPLVPIRADRPATSVSSAWDRTRMPSRRTSPSCSSSYLPTNANILGLAIVAALPCNVRPLNDERQWLDDERQWLDDER